MIEMKATISKLYRVTVGDDLFRRFCRCQSKCSPNCVGRTSYQVSHSHGAPSLPSTRSFCWSSCWWMRRSVFSYCSHWPSLHSNAPCGLRGCNASWFICWFRCYINCLFAYLTFSRTFFLNYLLPYLSTCLKIDLFHFQDGRHKRWPNLALALRSTLSQSRPNKASLKCLSIRPYVCTYRTYVHTYVRRYVRPSILKWFLCFRWNLACR